MTRDEIYDHLAQVYLGKKNTPDAVKPVKEKKQFSAWLVINILITVFIFATSFYGFTAFLTRRSDSLQNRIIYALNKGPIRVRYDLNYPHPQVKTFSIFVSGVDAERYRYLEFSVRGMEGRPGTLRIEVANKVNETSSVFVEQIGSDWSQKKILLNDFEQITDWSSVKEVQFVLESWNVISQKGLLMIDDVCFSSGSTEI